MRKSFIYLVVASAILSMGATAQNMPIQNKNLPNKEMIAQNKEIVSLAATEMNKGLPQVIDKYTNLIAIEGADTTLTYIFEINTGAKSDEAVKKEDNTRMKKAVMNGVCRGARRFLDAQIDISYLYKSAKSKAELFRFDISQADCNYPPK